ncbi:SusC/RagA family TonB-linked outer membrane protein [Ohtaekwangia koreensis]|uniref:TonB-linked outer membrane protein, SusC/RagA family n=1 Tax=Ohtaekwangia koreensis TaxID=688867 RepID=A0A1T5IUM9_9BACT|nr:TonB-dependent receptor [Ohtaekwangia koreensis]SKC42772.1 TonB-linked outer membrane protein, SusC/RagA family [Ohtaekwangia koreensis]
MIKKVYRSIWLASVCFFLVGLASAQAQRQVVSGKITDATGAALPGVSILVKGTTFGTSADVDGNYSLQASPDDVLVLTFIGYKSKEVVVGNQTQLDVTMEEDISTLQEVVVVGYGEQKKALNTGANLQVKGEDLLKQSSTNALQALQGQAPGVQITSTSGQPGEAMKVTIRGVGSNIGNNPLYVVDGVIVSDITYLNNGDIASLTVLKDAASAAIYGSQASNGVVLITTKKGKSGRAQVTFDSYYGIQNVARKADLLNAKEYAIIANEAAVNSGNSPIYNQHVIDSLGSAGTNWMDKMFVKDAVTQNYSIGVSGGNETSVYSSSLSYLSQAGIVGGKDLSNYKRYNFRFNSEHKLFKDVVTVGENMNFAFVDNHGIGVGNQYNNSLRGAFQTTPLLKDDKSDTVGMFNQANPYNQMVYNNQSRNKTQRIIGNVYFQVEPIKNLKFRSSLGIDYSSSDGQAYRPVFKLSVYSFNNNPQVSQSMSKNQTILWDNLLSYGFTLAAKHRFDVMAGTSVYKYSGSFLNASKTGSVFNDVEHAWVSNGTSNTATATGAANDPDHRLSFFGRLNYNFEETYLFNATFRADGSSKFAKGNQWGYFPSVSAGWVMTNESFMDNTSNWLNSLKLRASWGQVGSQSTPAFQYQSPIRFTNTYYIFGNAEGTLTPGSYPSRLSNPNLKWETSEQTDIGFDASFLNGKFNVNLDWYIKTNRNWLINPPILATAGAEAPYINGGGVTNKGIELALAYNNSLGDLNYRVSVNGAYNKNKVSKIPNADGIIHGQQFQIYDNSSEFNRASNGYPVGYFWGYKTNGLFQTEADVESYTSNEGTLLQPSAKPGDVRYVDVTGDGVIDESDKTMIGNPNPKFTFGFSVGADYKGFDLSIQASGVTGNQIVQSYRSPSNKYANYTTEMLDRWHGAGTSNRIPRVTETGENWANFSDLYVHDGDYLRINNVTLGYDLTKIIKQNYLTQCRLYVSALNLFTFTKYNGMDPEIGYGPDAFTSGVDVGYYPRPRTYMVGLNVKF